MSIGDAMFGRCREVLFAALVLVLPGMTATASAQDVEWTNLVNVSVDGTILQKTGGCDGCDDAGAQSQQQINSPGGYVEFAIGEANTFWIGGLSNGNGGPSYTGIDYAFRFNGAGGADVLQNGQYRGGDTAYAAGDIFRISVAYGRVQFWRNGTLLYTSRTAPTYPLVLDVALGTVGASLYNATISDDLVGDPPPPPPPLTTSNITWIDQVHVTVGDRVLQKTDGCGGCDDAGARSQEEIESGDGYIEFTVGEINTFWVAGLSHGNTDTSYGDIDFAFRFNGAGIADVLENGVYQGGDTLYTVGDVFRIQVIGGQVYFRHNGALVYTSYTAPTYPLLFDTALGSMDATIYNANLYLSGMNGLDGQNIPPGGFIEPVGNHEIRNRYTSPSDISFVPGQKGPFEFGSPYFSSGSRITDVSDCSPDSMGRPQDCVWYVGYSYWRRMNDHVGRDDIFILLGLDTNRGGTGPTLFRYHKADGQVQNVGGLFDDNNDPDRVYRYATAEQWYFSGSQWNILFALSEDKKQIKKFDIDPAVRAFVGVAMDIDRCPRDGGQFDCPADARYIDHPHSSDDDHVHSANVSSETRLVGCVAYRDNPAQGERSYLFFTPPGGRQLDECSVDKSGDWLMMLAGDDNIIFNLHTGASSNPLPNGAGAHGHFDLGYGYSVGADDQDGAHPNATTLIQFPPTQETRPLGPTVHYNNRWDLVAAQHISHTNARDASPGQQWVCGSDAERLHDPRTGDHPQRDEIVCFLLDPSYRHPGAEPPVLDQLVVAPVMTNLDLGVEGGGIHDEAYADYDRRPKGNLDITGEYFIWTTNMMGREGRLDAFIVKVPGRKLLQGP
jgi:hypothetical protein